jgi:N-acetyl-alpha-D-glucosaminyl L-malate synthase BshA
MRIGITCYPTYGGSGVVATELGKALALRGHEVHFIAYALPLRLDHVAENVHYHEVRVNAYPLFEYPPYALALASTMVDVAKHHGLDLLHVHYAIPHATSAVLARSILAREGIDLPVVTTLHGTDITLVGQDPAYLPVVDYSLCESDGVTAVSDYLRRETNANFCASCPVEVIPNFVDTERFRRMDKEHFRRAIAPNGEKLLVHVSNFRPVKRAADAVRVLATLLQSSGGDGAASPIKLLLVGDGPDRPTCEALARDLGVADAVRFLGKQEPVAEILSVADVMLLPSESETFGLAALEAMACAVPVVSSDAGGLPEVNLDGVTGYLRPVGDVPAMAAATRLLLEDEPLRLQMAEAARSRAVAEFDVHRIVPQYEAYYERVRAQATSA